jgi:hypothetical protein
LESGVGDVLPGIDPGSVGLVVVGLEPLAGGQLHVRHHEVQLQAALVLVFNPETPVLVGVQTGHQGPLKTVHDLGLGVGRNVLLSERQDA